MRMYVCAAFLCAAAGAATADLVGTGDARVTDVISSLDVTSGDFMSVNDAVGPRVATAGATYNGSAAWGDGVGFAPPVLDGAGAAVPNNDVFDGLTQAYGGGLPTQLGDTWGAAEFQGTNGAGNEFVQVNYFSTTGTTMDAFGATGGAFPVLGMAAGIGFFLSEGQDSINIDDGGAGVTFLSASFGFFDLQGNFLGAADISANNFSDAAGLAAIGVIDANAAGLAGNVGEMFISIEYEIVPAPASAALLGLGGLVAARRRR